MPHSDDPQPHVFNVSFAALRSTIPNDVKAVNFYQRVIGSPWKLETSFAFHTEHDAAQLALDTAQRSNAFVRGCTFARGLVSEPRAWIVADAWESES